jgi:hypothetical protein
LRGQQLFQIIECRGGMGAAQLGAAVWRGAAGLLPDSVDLCDPADDFFGDRGA